jgi:hypothetical protein
MSGAAAVFRRRRFGRASLLRGSRSGLAKADPRRRPRSREPLERGAR